MPLAAADWPVAQSVEQIAARDDLLHEQRTDTAQCAVMTDQSGPAPGGVWRGGKNRFIEQIFPIASEFALGLYPR